MSKVLLIDADSTIPNLALMKISTFHKAQGDEVELLRLNIPYYPNKKREIHDIPDNYDVKYCSVIFDNSIDWVKGNNIYFGGTGYSLDLDLPEWVESLEPDYSIYPDNNMSYGFISRGCIRNCYFCKVPKKEGYIRQVNKPEDIVRHNKTMFMDNNFLALPNHKEILEGLIRCNVKCQFNQGLDIRLVDIENSELLSKLNYCGDYIFAFDDWKYKKVLDNKLPMLDWRKDWGFKFFVYCHPNMMIQNIVNRVEYLKDRQILPYIMRDIRCYGSEHDKFYVDMAAWCNQPGVFKGTSFEEFLSKRHRSKNAPARIKSSLNTYNLKDN